MTRELLAMAIAFASASLVTPLLARAARASGWLDRPDRVRKRHASPIPTTGGSAVLLAVFWGMLPFGSHADGLVLIGLLIVFLTGLIDDWSRLRPVHKLAGQIAGCLAAAGSMETFTGHFPAFFLAFFWLLLCTNALNLIDGLDGCASVTGVIAALAILAIGSPAAWLLAPLAGALAGFLIHNLPPARVYLGDSGSMLIGFSLGYGALVTGEGTPQHLIAPAIAISLPLLDTGWAVIRRLQARRPLFQADRGHIHHLLLSRTGSSRTALAVITAINLAAASIAFAIH